MSRTADVLRNPSPVRISAWIAAASITALALYLVLRVETGTPAQLEVGGEVLFLRGWWEVGVAWGLAVATLLLAGEAGRRPRVALLALVPAVALAAWLLPPWMLDAEPDALALESGGPLEDGDRKTLLVAIDAFSWRRLGPLVEAGRLPHFARLMEEGSYGVLHSHRSYSANQDAMGYWSPVVWTTVATGVTEEVHGIHDFTLPNRRGKQRMAKSFHRRAPAFWDVFSAFHRPVGVVGWWASWPAEEVEGVMVSSGVGLRGHRHVRGVGIEDKAWFRKRRDLTHPESYKHVVAEDVGLPQGMDDRVDAEIFPYRRYPILSDQERDTLVSVLWQDRIYLDTTLHLLETEALALYATYFEGVDVIKHRFWQYIDHPEVFREETAELGEPVPEGFDLHRRVVERYYEVMDDYLGRLWAAAGDEATVVVISDHGFRDDPDHPFLADHSPYGVILARGPGIRESHDLNLSLPASLADLGDPVSVLDVLPTLLYLHGLPLSAELEGKVLTRALERSFVRRRPRLTIPDYGDFEATREVEVEAADEKEYLERMKALGYIG